MEHKTVPLNQTNIDNYIKNRQKKPYSVVVGMPGVGKTCMIDVSLHTLEWHTETAYNNQAVRKSTSKNELVELTIEGMNDYFLIDTAGENFRSVFIDCQKEPSELDVIFSYKPIDRNLHENHIQKELNQEFKRFIQHAFKVFVCLPLYPHQIDTDSAVKKASAFFYEQLKIQGSLTFIYAFSDLIVYPRYHLPTLNNKLTEFVKNVHELTNLLIEYQNRGLSLTIDYRKFSDDWQEFIKDEENLLRNNQPNNFSEEILKNAKESLQLFFQNNVYGNDIKESFIDELEKYDNFFPKIQTIISEENIINGNDKSKPLQVNTITVNGKKAHYFFALHLPTSLGYYQILELAPLNNPAVLASNISQIDNAYAEHVRYHQDKLKNAFDFKIDVFDRTRQKISKTNDNIKKNVKKQSYHLPNIFMFLLSFLGLWAVTFVALLVTFGQSLQIKNNVRADLGYVVTLDGETPNPFANLSNDKLQKSFIYLVSEFERNDASLYDIKPSSKNAEKTCKSMFTSNPKPENINYQAFLKDFYNNELNLTIHQQNLDKLRHDVKESTKDYLNKKDLLDQIDKIKNSQTFPRQYIEREDCINALADWWQARINLALNQSWQESEVANAITLFEKVKTSPELMLSANIEDNIQRELPLLQAWQAKLQGKTAKIIPVIKEEGNQLNHNLSKSQIPTGVFFLGQDMQSCSEKNAFYEQICRNLATTLSHTGLAMNDIQVTDMNDYLLDNDKFCKANVNKCEKKFERETVFDFAILSLPIAMVITVIIVIYRRKKRNNGETTS